MTTSPFVFSRRGTLRFAASAGVALLGIDAALAVEPIKGQTRFRSVEVDTRPLAEKGMANYAARITTAARPILASTFADRLDPAGRAAPRMILRIDMIYLSSDGDQNGGDPFDRGSRTNDYITGAAEIVDAKGNILVTQPVSSNQSPKGFGPDILAAERLRTQHLIEQIAYWAKQAV